MGFLEFLNGAGNYFDDRWKAIKQTEGDTFTQQLPEAWHNFWGGINTMAGVPQQGPGDFWHGSRLFLDGLLGFGETALGATFGAAFQAPGLHEGAWALDKAYRYGVAKPISWAFSDIANSQLAGAAAAKRGDSALGAYLSNLVSSDELWGKNGMWSDNVANTTPGQALMWAAGSQIGMLNPGNADNPLAWAQAHDPRSLAGQAEYNSADADFWLKYGSGSIDAITNIISDPTEPLMEAGRAARIHFDKVATDDYVIRGGVEKEIDSARYQKLYQAAKDAKSPEHFRTRTMFGARFGGSVSPLLVAAAKMDNPDLFRDVYLVARGLDGGFKTMRGGVDVEVGDKSAGLRVGAWERIVNQAPAIASDMSRLFANWNIGEDALGLGRTSDGKALGTLAMNDVDGFVAAIANRQGIWGHLPGRLLNEAQPKVSRISDFRDGTHSWIMSQAPVHVAKIFKPFLPSQGYSAFIDAQDATSLALRQVKANLERAGLPEDRVAHWVTNWGAKGSPEGRSYVYERAEDEALEFLAKKHGVTHEALMEAMPKVTRYRAATRQILKGQRSFFTDRVAQVATNLVEAGRGSEAKDLKVLGDFMTKEEKRGNFGDEVIAIPDSWGHTNVLKLPSSRKLPANAPDKTKPLTITQTVRVIPTFDFKALDGALKWWKMQHPPQMVRMAEDGKVVRLEEAGERFEMVDGEKVRRYTNVKPSARARTLSKMSKLHNGLDAAITAADFGNMVWKTSALLRPAQMPRNLADDVFRRYLIYGKLPLLMSLMPVPARRIQNYKAKRALKHEMKAEKVAARQAAKTDTYVIHADVDEAPKNLPIASTSDEARDIGSAWINGNINFTEFVRQIEGIAAKKGLAGDLVRSGLPPFVQSLLNERDKGNLDPTIFGREKAAREKKKRAQTREANRVIAENKRRQAHNKRVMDEKLDDEPILPLVQMPREAPASLRPDELSDEKIASLRVNATENRREFLRRLIQIYADMQPEIKNVGRTMFLDDRRIPPRMVDDEGDLINGSDPLMMHGPAGDPRYSPVDMRAKWLQELRKIHEQLQIPHGPREGGMDEAEFAESANRGYQRGQIIVDPFTGLKPKGLQRLEDGYDIKLHSNLNDPYTASGEINKNASSYLEYFIIRHLDDLMKPGNLLSLSVDARGNIRMGVARARPEVAAAAPIKLGAKDQYHNFQFDGIMDEGHTSVKIMGQNGAEYEFPGGFQGELGQVVQHRVSAQGGQGSFNYLLGDFSPMRLLDQQGGWGALQPEDKGYARSWERAVNAQIAGDAVARHFLQGRSESDVIHWIENTEDGTKYLHRMKHFGVNWVDHVRQIKALVDVYVPWSDTVAGRHLREAVLQRKARRGDLDAVMPKLEQPEVHGASVQYLTGRGAIFDMVAKGIDTAQRYISDLPTDKASRFPFYNEAYKRHLTSLVRVADFMAAKSDDIIPIDLQKNLEQQARDKALYDTKYSLYDVAQVNDLARLTRLIVPFSSAIMDSYIKYGRIVKNNPAAILQGLYYWQMFERNDAVQDQDGNVLKVDGDGVERWYQQDPDGKKPMVEVTGHDGVGENKYVQFRLPSALGHVAGKWLYGVNHAPVFAINKKNFNVFIDLPASGPMVAVLANHFALNNPEFGETKVIKQFVLPFGPSANWTTPFIPPNIRSAWNEFVTSDEATAEGQAKAIYQAELISFAKGERDHPPTIPEARERASMLMGLRFTRALTTWFSPVSFQPVSPYQPYIDAYHQLANEDPATADERFNAQHGDEFYAVAMTVTRNNAGLRATLSSDAAFKRHRDLIAAYPDLAGLIVGADGGSFSKSVYEAQKTETLKPGGTKKVREVMSLEESVAELEKRRVWDQYTKMMDLITTEQVSRGLTTLRGATARDLTATRDQFIEQNKYWTDPTTGEEVHSPWYSDFTSVDHAAIQSRIEDMWSVVQDKDLQKRDDIRGLIGYLSARLKMQQQMARAGTASLDSSKATKLAQEWAGTSFALREANPAFGQLWARWLSNDDKLDMGA